MQAYHKEFWGSLNKHYLLLLMGFFRSPIEVLLLYFCYVSVYAHTYITSTSTYL